MGLGRPSGEQGDDSLSIGALYRHVDRAIHDALPGQLWVTGEVRSVSVSSRGICYMDLVDPANRDDSDRPVLKVVCWSTRWARIRTSLDRLGITFDAGMVVRVRGEVQLYQPRGEISFIVSELDTDALLGKVAAERARLVKALVDADLYDRNRRIDVPSVPSCIGLVASPGTEGFRDFMGQLEESGIGFPVRVVPTRVQGRGAPALVAGAVRRLQSAGCDVIVIVRGGGSKADLATFDAEPVARAIARSDVAVWTGIGHTGDLSVADEVANRTFITPTDCGQELATVADAYWRSTVGRGLEALAPGHAAVGRRPVRSSERRRRSVETCTDRQVDRHADRLVHRARSLRGAARGPGRRPARRAGQPVPTASRGRFDARTEQRGAADAGPSPADDGAAVAVPRGGGAPHVAPQEPARCLRLPAPARTGIFGDPRCIRRRRAIGTAPVRARCPARVPRWPTAHRIGRVRTPVRRLSHTPAPTMKRSR